MNKALDEINTIIEYSKNVSIVELQNNHPLLDGIVFRMIQMSENIDKISDEFKLMHQEIKWINIKGFRNRLVHNYGNVDLQFVYNAISKDIHELKEQIIKIL